MFSIRTDLALEAHKMCSKNVSKINGVKATEKKDNDIIITHVDVLDDNGEKAIGKPKGTYITIESPQIKFDTKTYEKTCAIIGDKIKEIAKTKENGITLVVGLGNKSITPDALGQDVVSKIMVTHHIKTHMPQAIDQNISSVCAISPGVLGTTGMESSEIISGVADKLKPDLIIVVDALAAADYRRIGTTFQICDTGIQPGAGVGNNRQGINKETMGVKVIAIGVPTVVDANTFSIREANEEKEPLMVTPKDIDLIIERASKTVANGINLALHSDITLKDIEEFVG